MLIHKTMRMPKSCLSCWIAQTCEVWVAEKKKYKGYDNRLENCPLEEVKHGHWVIERGETVMHCNSCGWAYEYYGGLEEEWNYCPHCGAKMDEVTE